jgi:lysophospholipase L1-like esterase
MRRPLLQAFLALALTVCVFAEAPSLAGKRVLVLGDSITQDGRYVSDLDYYFRAAGRPCDLISIGLSSETISGLSEKTEVRPCVVERLARALKAVQPQIVIACYGMNDGIYHPPSPEILRAFNAGVRSLIDQVRATGASLVLITPPVFDPLPIAARTLPPGAADYSFGHPYSGYNETLAQFAAAEVALHEPGLTVIDLHTPMTAALAARRVKEPTFSFARDGVHPGDLGHLAMAHLIAAGFGLATPADLDAELLRLQADPVYALVRDRRELRSEAWLPYVGYTHGATYKSASVGAEEKVAARLQREIGAAVPK